MIYLDMGRDGYVGITLTEPILRDYLQKLTKKEHRQSNSETAQAILLDFFNVPESELRESKKGGNNK